jgi:hypothetical protein
MDQSELPDPFGLTSRRSRSSSAHGSRSSGGRATATAAVHSAFDVGGYRGVGGGGGYDSTVGGAVFSRSGPASAASQYEAGFLSAVDALATPHRRLGGASSSTLPLLTQGAPSLARSRFC